MARKLFRLAAWIVRVNGYGAGIAIFIVALMATEQDRLLGLGLVLIIYLAAPHVANVFTEFSKEKP